jgi:RNA-directed DNA polymerase
MRVSGRKTGSALSHVPDNWYAVDWRRVERNVRGMQIRIAKATRESDWRRVKALQRMLTRTLSAKLHAVRRVTQNQGARTAGVDCELWDSPESRWAAIGKLKRRGYEPGWHDHHLEYRMHGGSDALSNRVLLHPHCHQQVHARGTVVTKPALP